MSDAVDKVKKLQKQYGTSSPSSKPEKPKKADIIQLPIWPDRARGLPNALARSALFTVRYRRTKREYFKQRPVATLAGCVITYTGEELRQDDETVFLQLLHLARAIPLGEPIEFTPYSFLKQIDWPTAGKNHYDRLAATIERLTASMVGIKAPGAKYGGSLVRKFVYKDGDGERLRMWRIWLEPEIVNLFQTNSYTRLEWMQRLELSRPLAMWLHSFYQTHAEPFPMKVETLRALTGSNQQDLSAFRQQLMLALQELWSVGFLTEFRIDEESYLVHVKRA